MPCQPDLKRPSSAPSAGCSPWPCFARSLAAPRTRRRPPNRPQMRALPLTVRARATPCPAARRRPRRWIPTPARAATSARAQPTASATPASAWPGSAPSPARPNAPSARSASGWTRAVRSPPSACPSATRSATPANPRRTAGPLATATQPAWTTARRATSAALDAPATPAAPAAMSAPWSRWPTAASPCNACPRRRTAPPRAVWVSASAHRRPWTRPWPQIATFRPRLAPAVGARAPVALRD